MGDGGDRESWKRVKMVPGMCVEDDGEMNDGGGQSGKKDRKKHKKGYSMLSSHLIINQVLHTQLFPLKTTDTIYPSIPIEIQICTGYL